jgi:hypothetical protein
MLAGIYRRPIPCLWHLMTYVTMMPRVPREVDGDASRNVITAPSSFFAMR